jgi:hypothetical protein
MRTFVVTMTDGEEKHIHADEVITPMHNAAVLTFVADNRPVAIVNTANVRMVVAQPATKEDVKAYAEAAQEMLAAKP